MAMFLNNGMSVALRLRRALGLTLEQFAELMDVSTVTVSRWMTDDHGIRRSTLDLMARLQAAQDRAPVPAHEIVREIALSGRERALSSLLGASPDDPTVEHTAPCDRCGAGCAAVARHTAGERRTRPRSRAGRAHE